MRRILPTALLLFLLLGVVLSAPSAAGSSVGFPPRWTELSTEYTYEQYLRHWRKAGPGDAAERVMRQGLFDVELASVLAHNKDTRNTYKRGINWFTDRTPEERSNSLMEIGRRAFINRTESGAEQTVRPVMTPPPAAPSRRTVDYRLSVPAVLTTVKDQGNCGSCWSFGTIETLEAHQALQTGLLADLSEQQIISCVPPLPYVIPSFNFSSTFHGCHGYIPTFAYEYIAEQQSGVVTQEYEVPYQSYWAQNRNTSAQYRPTPVCMNDKNRTVAAPTVNVTGAIRVSPINSAAALEETLVAAGPVATIITVPPNIFTYESGIFNDPLCEGSNTMTPDHVVQVVGFGYDKSAQQNYWIIRNSWSPWWGERGYIRLLKKADGETCGKMQFADLNGPLPLNFTPMTACGPCGMLIYNAYPSLTA